nr:MAG TPA: hypothetical protein [Caudoviricetes sp.]
MYYICIYGLHSLQINKSIEITTLRCKPTCKTSIFFIV